MCIAFESSVINLISTKKHCFTIINFFQFQTTFFSCMKRLHVRIRSSLLVTITFKCTNITILITLNINIFTSIKVIKNTCTHIYTETKVIKNAKLIKAWVQLNCFEYWAYLNNVALFHWCFQVDIHLTQITVRYSLKGCPLLCTYGYSCLPSKF